MSKGSRWILTRVNLILGLREPLSSKHIMVIWDVLFWDFVIPCHTSKNDYCYSYTDHDEMSIGAVSFGVL